MLPEILHCAQQNNDVTFITSWTIYPIRYFPPKLAVSINIHHWYLLSGYASIVSTKWFSSHWSCFFASVFLAVHCPLNNWSKTLASFLTGGGDYFATLDDFLPNDESICMLNNNKMQAKKEKQSVFKSDFFFVDLVFCEKEREIIYPCYLDSAQS